MKAAAWICLLLPLASAVLITLGGTRISRRLAGYISTLTTMGAFAAAVVAFFTMWGEHAASRTHVTTSWTWLSAGPYHFGLSLLVDQLSVMMMLIVAGVGSLIVAYSVGYMDGEDEERRYFAYMSLFVFSMLLLVQGGNLLLLLAGWGMVGLSSYLLIGFYQDRPSAIAAAKKAFVMNAFGDATMALALFLLIQHTRPARLRRRVRVVAARWSGREPDRARAARRRGREERADPVAHVAAGRDGRADAGQRTDPCGDDGHGRRVPDRALPSAVRERVRDPGSCGRARRGDVADGGIDRARADGHQARDRVFDDVADRLHVRRRRARRVPERDVPPDDARVLQGAALPVGRPRDPRDRRRAGHSEAGRDREADAVHQDRLPDRLARARRHPAVRRLLLEGLDPGGRARPRLVRDRDHGRRARSARS